MTMKQQLALTLGELFDCFQEVLLVWAKRENNNNNEINKKSETIIKIMINIIYNAPKQAAEAPNDRVLDWKELYKEAENGVVCVI